MRSSIDRLTALDQLMLRASRVWPQDISALALLDGTNLVEPTGRFRIEAVREAIRSRLHLVPRFRQLLYVPPRGLGGPLWVDAPSFDLSQHVRVLPLPADTGEAELLLAIERRARSCTHLACRPIRRQSARDGCVGRSSNPRRRPAVERGDDARLSPSRSSYPKGADDA
jgi:Wax ester synthase-like Acyl-CoA acyltransferase domain